MSSSPKPGIVEYEVAMKLMMSVIQRDHGKVLIQLDALSGESATIRADAVTLQAGGRAVYLSASQHRKLSRLGELKGWNLYGRVLYSVDDSEQSRDVGIGSSTFVARK